MSFLDRVRPHLPRTPFIVITLIIIGLFAYKKIDESGSDFSVSGSGQQVVLLGDAESLVIHLYCKNTTINRTSEDEEIRLDITATYSSLGYHGTQWIPRKMPGDLLEFEVSRANHEIRLESREYTFIHHANIIDRLVVDVPEGIKIRFEQILDEELEGRDVRKDYALDQE